MKLLDCVSQPSMAKVQTSHVEVQEQEMRDIEVRDSPNVLESSKVLIKGRPLSSLN